MIRCYTLSKMIRYEKGFEGLPIKMNPFDAAALGTYIHGLAGDAAAEALGEYSVMASDIIDHISEIMKDCHEA